MLKVHVTLVAIYGAEDEIKAFFHLLLAWSCLVDPSISHDSMILLRLDRINSHAVVHQGIGIKQGAQQFASIQHLLLGLVIFTAFPIVQRLQLANRSCLCQPVLCRLLKLCC